SRAQRLLQRLHTKLRIQAVAQSPRQHKATPPIHHCHQIQKPIRHRHIRHVRTPHLIGSRDLEVLQKIRINLVPRRGLARRTLRIDRLDPHHSQQPSYSLAIHSPPLPPQHHRQSPTPLHRPPQPHPAPPPPHPQLLSPPPPPPPAPPPHRPSPH